MAVLLEGDLLIIISGLLDDVTSSYIPTNSTISMLNNVIGSICYELGSLQASRKDFT